jgi:hypothetical protein
MSQKVNELSLHPALCMSDALRLTLLGTFIAYDPAQVDTAGLPFGPRVTIYVKNIYQLTKNPCPTPTPTPSPTFIATPTPKITPTPKPIITSSKPLVSTPSPPPKPTPIETPTTDSISFSFSNVSWFQNNKWVIGAAVGGLGFIIILAILIRVFMSRAKKKNRKSKHANMHALNTDPYEDPWLAGTEPEKPIAGSTLQGTPPSINSPPSSRMTIEG